MTDDPEHYDPNPNDNYLPVEWVPRDAVEPNDWNPNSMEDDARDRLRKSITDNGWTQPIVVHADEHYIIDGEQRWTVAGHANVEENPHLTPEDVPAGYVPIYAITVEEGQAKMATIQHNRARGNVDVHSMEEYLSQLNERVDLREINDRLGMDMDDIGKILDDVTAADIGEDVDGFGAPWEPVPRHELSEEEMDEGRSGAMRRAIERSKDEDLTEEEREKAEEVAKSSKRLNFVVSEDEEEIILEAVGETDAAQSAVNLIDFVMQNRLLNIVRPHLTNQQKATLYERYDERYAERVV